MGVSCRCVALRALLCPANLGPVAYTTGRSCSALRAPAVQAPITHTSDLYRPQAVARLTGGVNHRIPGPHQTPSGSRPTQELPVV